MLDRNSVGLWRLILGHDSKIFSLAWENNYRYILTCRNKAKYFLLLEKIIKYFLFLGNTITDKVLLAETKPKIFFCLEKHKIYILLWYVLNEAPYRTVVVKKTNC